MNFDISDLPEDVKEEIIGASMEMIRVLSIGFGADDGLKAWEQISETFGRGVKEQLFMSMLVGRTHGSIRVRDVTGGKVDQAVPIIKTIRAYTGLGLKESKDHWDTIRSGRDTHIKVDWKFRSNLVSDLRKFGLEVV